MESGLFSSDVFSRDEAGLDSAGNVVGWQHRIVGQSILRGTPFEAMLVKDGVDMTSIEGAATLPYAIPNLMVDLHSPQSAFPSNGGDPWARRTTPMRPKRSSMRWRRPRTRTRWRFVKRC